MLKNHVFASHVFSCFLVIFGAFWEAFWLSFGVLLESPTSLWRAGVVLLGAFGSPEPSVGSLFYFLLCLLARQGCLWAPGPVRYRFLVHLGTILGPFWNHFLRNSGVDFEAVLIYFLIVACSASVLGAFVWVFVFLVMG